MKIDWTKTIFENSKKIILYFHNHILPAAIFKRYQKLKYGSNFKTLKLPVKTRWWSSAICLDSLYKNQLALSLAITEISNNSSIELDNEIKAIILNENFWMN